MTSVLGEVGVVFDLEIKYLLPDSSYQLTLDATPSLPPPSNRLFKMKIALLLFSTTWFAPSFMNCKRRHRPIDKQKSLLSLFSVFFKMENRNKCHLGGGGKPIGKCFKHFAASLIVLHPDWKKIADKENVWFAEKRENDERG